MNDRLSISIGFWGFVFWFCFFFINSQFLDAFVSKVHWGHLEPLASVTKTHGFLGSFCLELFSTDIKGALSSSEGCDQCQKPPQAKPLKAAAASWPLFPPEMVGFLWFSVYGAGQVPLDERRPNIN